MGGRLEVQSVLLEEARAYGTLMRTETFDLYLFYFDSFMIQTSFIMLFLVF